MYSTDVLNHFLIDAKNYDCSVTISFSGKNKELLRELLGRVYLDVDPDKYEFAAFPVDENISLLERTIFIKIKKD